MDPVVGDGLENERDTTVFEERLRTEPAEEFVHNARTPRPERVIDRIAHLRGLSEVPGVMSRRLLLTLVLLGSMILGLIGCTEGNEKGGESGDKSEISADDFSPELSSQRSDATVEAAEFAGSETCTGCHPNQAALWRGSHHDRAMEVASRETIEARFDGETFPLFEQTWRFDQADGEFLAELLEPGREPRRWPIAYSFGAQPLQQYLVAFPDGRFQALPIAWDTRPADQGGARWFSLLPNEPIPEGDPLHWEGLAYNWNSQCASCHSTHLEKNYDAATDRFDTRFAEIDVACEACHGRGSRHVEWMKSRGEVGGRPEGSGLGVELDEWDPGRWVRESGARIAAPIRAREADNEIDVCAPCHSRRSPIVATPEIGAPFLDGHRPRMLESGFYFEDGQIRDEVYVYGSFLQSRMYAAGVRCSDCHEPHSLALRREGNALCEGCHSPAAYASKAHHGHESTSTGAACVACHMPERTYLEIDPRWDHSFVVPNPDRSATLGAPSVCQGCHPNRDSAWANARIAEFSGSGAALGHWSDRLVSSDDSGDLARQWLDVALDPIVAPIVRGSAWMRFAESGASAPPLELLKERFARGSDLERLGLIQVARRLPADLQLLLLGPLLEAERRALRIGAAEVLSALPPSVGRPADRSRLARALREYRAAQEANSERAEAQVNLGVLETRAGDPDAARAAYMRALERAEYFVPAYVNLADLDRALGRDADSVERLRQALALVPDDATVRYALGLALHRTGRSAEALAELERAALAAPEQPRLSLAWALSLDAAGRREEAIARLSDAIERGVLDANVFQAIASLLHDDGQITHALEMTSLWQQAFPTDARARALAAQIVSAASNSDATDD